MQQSRVSKADRVIPLRDWKRSQARSIIMNHPRRETSLCGLWLMPLTKREAVGYEDTATGPFTLVGRGREARIEMSATTQRVSARRLSPHLCDSVYSLPTPYSLSSSRGPTERRLILILGTDRDNANRCKKKRSCDSDRGYR